MKSKWLIGLIMTPVLIIAILFITKQTGSQNIATNQTYAPVEFSSSVDTVWVRHYAGEPIPGIDRAVDVVLDQSGNIYVTGYVASTESGYNYYTIKYKSSGSAIWSARYDGTTGDDKPVGICVDAAGNVYVTGTSGQDYATIQYDASGAEQWIARYNCPPNAWSTVAGIDVDDSGNIYVAGTIEIGNTLMFFLIIKYDPTGKEEWTARYDGQWGADNNAVGIVVDGFGNVIVSGSFCSIGEGIPDQDYTTLKYNSNGMLQWVARFNGPGNSVDKPADLAVDESGNVYVTGSSTFAAGDGSCYTTVKYDSLGIQQWIAIYDSPESGSGIDWSYPTALAVNDSGYVYVTGVSLGVGSYSDYATIKYDALGEELWIARYNGPDNSLDEVSTLVLDNSNNVYVTGASVGSGTGYDFATIKYDANGIEKWIARYSGPDNTGDIPTAMAVDESGMVYVTGAGDIHYSWGMPYELYCNYTTIKYDTSGGEQWIIHYDGPGEIHASASDMAIDEAGNVYVTGSCPGELTPRGRSNDYITVKYDDNGAVVWANRCKEGSQATNIALDDRGNVYVTGFGDEGGYITMKYNAAGNEQWVAHCDRAVVVGYSSPGFPWQISLAVDRSGNVYVAGGIDITNDNSDYIVIKYDSSGSEQWLITYDGPGNFFDEANALAVDDPGNVYVTGKSYGAGTLADLATIKYNAQGIAQWVARYNGSANSWDEGVDIAVDDSSNVYVTGRTRSSTTGEDFVTIKYDAMGATQWIARYNGTQNDGWDEATALTLDNAGNVYVTGLSNGYGDYATVKYNNSGAQQWVARYSNSEGRSYDFPYDLAVDVSGNVYVTGFSIGLSDMDFTTIKYNSSGVEQWIAQYNGPGNCDDEAWCVAVNDAGHVYVAGTSSGSNWSLMTLIKYRQTSTSVKFSCLKTLPSNFSLSQNFPNPFNPSTTIEFALPKSAFVTLKVYNLLGEEIATLIAEQRMAGIHRVNWNARGLASGVYLYRLEAVDYVQCKKLILMR